MIKNIDKYKFEDLFDLDKMQKLTDAMSLALEVGVVIVSPDGIPITKPSNFCSFCMDVVRKSPIGSRNCAYSDTVLGRRSDAPIVSKCLSAGLTDAGVSIVIGGRHLASWMIGQVMIEEDMLTEEELRERARELEIDETLFMEAVRTVPVKTKEQLNHILDMVHIMAMQLSEFGLQSYMQKEELAYHAKLEKELRGEKEKLEIYHTYDELTNLYTRAYYESRVNEMIQKKEYPIVIIMGDMNNLKLYNDVFGHNEGDTALRALSAILQKEAGEKFIIGRCGGDEFGIAIPQGREEMAEDYCKRVHAACINITDAMIPPSVALGYCVLESEETELAQVVKQAEEAMYNAKMKKKLSQNIHQDIMEVLYRKQYISERQVNEAVERIGRFGKYLGLEDYNIFILELAARLQDVGLIGVPEAVVKKETARTAEEYAKMAKHTEIGYRLARLYDESFPAADVILQSHECWFGKGYPNQLRGKEILFNARVLYMVGTYSGWIFPKPTGSNMAPAAARMRLRGEAGRQFDPELVEKFLKYLEEEEKIQ